MNRSANGFLPDKMPEEEKKVVEDFFVSGGESLLSKVPFKSQPSLIDGRHADSQSLSAKR